MKKKTINLSKSQLREVLQKMIKEAISLNEIFSQLNKTGSGDKDRTSNWGSNIPTTTGLSTVSNANKSIPGTPPTEMSATPGADQDKTNPGTPGAKGSSQAPMVAPTGPSAIPTTQEPQQTMAMALKGLQGASKEQIKAIMSILNPQNEPQE